MSNAIVAKARSMYGNFLKEENYQELLRKKSVSEIASYLKNQTHYSEVLEDVREYQVHRGQLEDLVQKDQFLQITKMMRYANPKDKKFYQLSLLQVEMYAILHQIRAIISQEFEEALLDMPYYLKPYMRLDLSKISAARSLDALASALEKTPYSKLLTADLLNKDLEFSYYELVLERYYYKTIFETIDAHFKGKMRKELFKIYATDVELTNIVRIYRLKQYFNMSGEEIEKTLIPIYNGKIRKYEMLALCNVNTGEDVLAFAKQKNYQIGEEDKKKEDYVAVEYFQNRIEFTLLRKHIYYSIKAPLVFTSFMKLQENEISNIINIIEGVRYGVDAESIASMLIY